MKLKFEKKSDKSTWSSKSVKIEDTRNSMGFWESSIFSLDVWKGTKFFSAMHGWTGLGLNRDSNDTNWKEFWKKY